MIKALEIIKYFVPLISAGCLDIIVALFFYYLKSKSKNNVIVNVVLEQVLIGLVFGLCTIYATEIGCINIGNAIINNRNAAVLIAGLIFGGPAGIIAGTIGGIERWFCVYWGGGEYTRLACTIACFFASIVAASFRNFVFHKKIPNALYGLFIAIVVETFHILLVFITHMNDGINALAVVEQCTIPMTIITSLTLFITLAIINIIQYIDKARNNAIKKDVKSITEKLQLCLFVVIVLVSIISLGFESFIMKGSELAQAESAINITIEDMKEEYLEINQSSSGILKQKKYSYHIGETGGVFIVNKYFAASSYIDVDRTVKTPYFEVEDKENLNEEELFLATLNGKPVYCCYIDLDDEENNDNNVGRKIVGFLPKEEALLSYCMTQYITVFIFIIIYAILFVVIYVIVNTMIVKRLKAINATLTEIANGNLQKNVNERSSYEFNSLSDYINKMIEALKEFIKDAKKRIAEEIELSKKIQGSVLPSIFPPYPNVKSFDIFASMTPAREVGGDFYDFYFIDNTKFLFMIADVSGKSIPGAMFMMQAKSVIKSYAESELPIEEVAIRSNEELCKNNEAEMFVTSFICIVNLKTGLVEYVNAGHNPPIIVRKGANAEYLKPIVNMVFAGMEGVKYKKGELTLEKGDTMYLYTDGVTEAINSNKEQYGEGRLINAIKNNSLESVDNLCHNIKSDLDNFVDGYEQFDDITMLAFRYRGESQVKEIVVDAKIENVDKVTDFINTELEKINCPIKTQTEIDIAIDEIFSNIANYAYSKNEGKATVLLEICDNPKAVIITFVDSGVPYDPLKKQDPNTKLPLEDREIGGLGIFMVKKSMDSVEYDYKDSKNILKIKKNI